MSRIVELNVDPTCSGYIAHQVAQALENTPDAAGEGDDGGIYVILMGAQSADFVGVGLKDLHKVETQGSVGSYGFANTDNCECVVQGNAGDYF
jgi:hypothetical protein